MKTYLELVDLLGLAVIATNPEGTITHWNGAAASLYGWSADEVLGRNIVGVTPAEVSREQAAEIMRALSAGRVWSGEFPVRDREGRCFRAAVTDLPFASGDGADAVTGVVGISAPAGPPSPLAALLERVVTAAQLLWPGRVVPDVDFELGGAPALVSDPHMLQLIALLLRHQVSADGPPTEISARAYSQSQLEGFHVTDGPNLYVRIAQRGVPLREPLLREMRRVGAAATYVGALVRLAEGKLFVGGSRNARSLHLLIPPGRSAA